MEALLNVLPGVGRSSIAQLSMEKIVKIKDLWKDHSDKTLKTFVKRPNMTVA